MNEKSVQLIDAGSGNLRSVQNALQNQGANIHLVEKTSDWKEGLRTVLPGVGAFKRFMDGLKSRGLIEPIMEACEIGTPLLGICVGMQALFDQSEEMGVTAGLGLIHGNVLCFPRDPQLKVPHTGWNEVNSTRNDNLLKSISLGSYYYFNHSYYCKPSNMTAILAQTDYILPFASAVQVNNIFGVQFHPEKSQTAGLLFLKNFLEL
jgi:imidazole glycerol-phosphate synthase subunit HisH